MELRTFYWDPRQTSRRSLLDAVRRRKPWRIGNAGDLLSVDIARVCYGAEPKSVIDEGRRALFVGSVAHRIQDHDVVAGIGAKEANIPQRTDVTLWGVRGPLTLEAFDRAGYDTSSVRFLGDPGLLIGEWYPSLATRQPVKGRVLYVPHYREPRQSVGKRAVVASVDALPLRLAEEIADSEFVATTSLHALIFAHALGRPATLVRSESGESDMKYRDYFASVGLSWRTPPSLDEVLRGPKPTSGHDVSQVVRSIELPSQHVLAERGVLRAG